MTGSGQTSRPADEKSESDHVPGREILSALIPATDFLNHSP